MASFSFDLTNEDTNINGSWSSEASDSMNGGLDCQGDARFKTSSCSRISIVVDLIDDEYVFFTEVSNVRDLGHLRKLIDIWQAHCASLREEFSAVEPFSLD